MKNKDVSLVCPACGITANYLTCLKKYGRPPLQAVFTVSTLHNGTCDVCGHFAPVTESRDFFYPDFELIFSQIRYDHEPTGNNGHFNCATCDNNHE